MQTVFSLLRSLILAGLTLWLGVSSASVQAAPPLPWSRDYEDWLKNERPYEDAERRRSRDHGWFGGHCNREEIAGAIGGALGGYIGSQIDEDEVRLGATAAGALLGFFIGTRIGRSMDDDDSACSVPRYERTAHQPRYSITYR